VLCRDVIIPGASNTIRAAEHDYHTECLLEAYAAIQRGFAKRKEQPDG
jgi:hypothetical protein